MEHLLSQALAKVNHTMEKYKPETHDICEQYGQPIDPARPEALPYASLCIKGKANQTKQIKSRSA